MKVLLLQNVKKVGQKGELVEVSDGFAINFLIKQSLAKIATKDILKQRIKEEVKKEKVKKEKKDKDLEVLSKLNNKVFKIKTKTNDHGHLFAKISKKQIADLVGLKIENILLKEDIKKVGEFIIKINLAGKIIKIILEVKSD